MMLDKNGVEIKTGMVVEITGAYFKNDNGLYYVERSPGDPSWCGSDYSLRKISKAGKISTAKYNIAFWPLMVTVSGWRKRMEAQAWNAEHSEIEVKAIKNVSEIAAHFEAEAAGLEERIKWTRWNFGEEHPEVAKLKELQAHYMSVAKAVVA